MTTTLLTYTLTKTTRRLTFDIIQQDDRVTYQGDDDGPYFKFTASNGYEVISRSRMDIQTERLWLLGAKRDDEPRSGTMVFSSNQKRDAAYTQFVQALDEWAAANGGRAQQTQEPVAWAYELATNKLDDVYGGWRQYLTSERPRVPEGSVRNLRPLVYANTTPQPQPAPPVHAPVDERGGETFPPPTPIDSEELDAWVCDHCNGDGWHWQEHQVGERKTDVQQLKTHCDKCEGLGYCGPDAKARAALQSPAPQATKGQP